VNLVKPVYTNKTLVLDLFWEALRDLIILFFPGRANGEGDDGYRPDGADIAEWVVTQVMESAPHPDDLKPPHPAGAEGSIGESLSGVAVVCQ